jgi:hypothetical protein
MGFTRESERTILLGTILLASAVSAATGFVLAQYYSFPVLNSVLYPPQDCWLGWPLNVGRHCFNDYTVTIAAGLRPNPWEPYPVLASSHYEPFRINYMAAGMAPHMVFAHLGNWLGSPRLGLFGYLFVLTIAVLSPAMWAARGARGLERMVVFMLCGAAAVPAWFAVDRGNSVGFLVPIMLVFLVALRRRQWTLVAIMVILAALLKPQFAVLVVALFTARQWRLGGITVLGTVISNLAAYLLWPLDFPDTVAQSIRNVLDFGSFGMRVAGDNVSFAKALLLIPDNVKAFQAGGKIPDGFLAGPRSLIGYGILALVALSLLALGRRIPPVMVGIVLLATASLFPAVVYHYYLVFALPVAALVARDPDGPPGSGIFDQLGPLGDRRRVVGICASLAAALSIAAPIMLPGPSHLIPIAGEPGVIGLVSVTPVVDTTVILTPLLWLFACAAIIVSYLRRPIPGAWADAHTSSALVTPTPAAVSRADSE